MSVRAPGVSFASASPRQLAVAVSSSPSSVAARNTALLPPMSPASLPPDAKRTLHVHLASTGRYFELSVGLGESIASLKESLAGVLAISHTDQILMTDTGVVMDERRTLGQHPFAAASNADIRVFVFNRGDLTAGGQQQRRQLASAPMTLPLPPLLLPTDHDSLVRCPPRRAIGEARGSYTKMMPTFEQHFCRSLLEANVYLGAFADLLRRARNGRVEQEAVMAALDAALLSLDAHADHVRTKASTFKQSFDSAAKHHHALFDGFARDVEALKEVEITGKMRRYAGVIQPPSPAMEPVPAGATNTAPLALTPAALPVAPASAPAAAAPSSPRLTLHAVAVSSLPSLTRLRDQLSHDQKHLDRKVEEMTAKWTKVDAKVRELRVGPDRTPAHRKPEILATLAELAHLLRADPSNEHSVESFAGIHQQLQADYSAVVDYLDQLERQLTIAPPASNGASQLLDLPLSVDDAFKKFKELDDQHDDLLERFRQEWTFLTQSMVPLLAQSASAIQTVFTSTHAQLDLLSTHVTNVESVLPMQKIALQRLVDAVREKLQPINMLPTAYAALLTEVPRRRAFHRRFLQEAQSMAARIHTVAAGERQRRDEWHKQYGAFLPKGASLPGGWSGWSGGFGPLLSHLFDRPPLLDLSFTDFDTGLPDLDGSEASAAAAAATAAGAASGGKSPKLHTAGSLSRNSSSNALPSLPAIEEASSGSGSNGDAEDAAGDHTHSSLRPKSSAAERAVEGAFPWMAELEKERAKVRALEQELAAMREQREQSTSLAKNLAATISPAGGKATGSRKNSITELQQQQHQASNTNSPTASSRSSGGSSADWRAKFETEKQRSDELALNAAAQERKLAELKGLETQKTKLIEALERAQADLKTEQEGREGTAKDAYKNFKSSQEKLDAAGRRLEVAESECDMLRQQLELLSLRSARKLALNDFTISDLILFYQNPSRVGPAGGGLDQLEVFNLNAPNYFLSPDSAQAYKTKLRMRQEKLDETMAKAMHAAGGVSSPASAATAPAAAAANPSSSSSAAGSPPLAVVPFGDIGQVLFVHSGLVASAGQNPFRLPIGTKYHLLDVEMQLQDDQEEKQA